LSEAEDRGQLADVELVEGEEAQEAEARLVPKEAEQRGAHGHIN
jgi:hypothetical protein